MEVLFTTSKRRIARTAKLAESKSAEIAYWESIKNSVNPDEFQAYLNKYPSGEFTDIARSRLDSLEAAAKEAEERKAKEAEEQKAKEEAKARAELNKSVQSNLNIVINSGIITVNGKTLRFPAAIGEYESVLGKPSRKLPSNYDHAYVWDDFGIFFYVDPASLEITRLTIALNDSSYPRLSEESPRNLFSGSLVIDGAVITRDSTVDSINNNKSGGRFEKLRDVEDYWLKYGDIIIFIELDSERHYLYEVRVWKRKRL